MTTSAKKAASKTTPKTSQTKVARPAAAATGPSMPVLVPGIEGRRIPLPRMGLPHVPTPRVPVPEAVSSRLPKSNKEKLVWFGGLAGMAALGVINWPVAGVVAAGTFIAERGAKVAVREEFAATAPDTTQTSKGSTG